MRNLAITCLTAIFWPLASHAQSTAQPYAGFETRNIASLSADDIIELEAGRGWGLALPAELNGYPGPAHVLELADKLDLTERQRTEISAIFQSMQKEAKSAGARLIAAERALDHSFAETEVTPSLLRPLIADAESARADLRFVHLSRHLQTVTILKDPQIERYMALRGYASDPCLSVPDGHNEKMWRRHNGCTD